ncbi:MAG TPA: RNA polymerase sigma factor [Bryobacteraceae bacterium]|nr:RNA polymerase sigma factor [Bryobacteraceae bacterium]
MFAVRGRDAGGDDYQRNLTLIRERILGFARRRLVPHEADFAAAEDLAQACVVTLWERYPEKRELSEMMAIAIGIARHKIAQFRRERERSPGAATDVELLPDEDVFEQIAARESVDRFLRAMLQLAPRCRELLRLKLIEEHEYAEIRLRMGITGNIYEMAKRCHKSLLRLTSGAMK